MGVSFPSRTMADRANLRRHPLCRTGAGRIDTRRIAPALRRTSDCGDARPRDSALPMGRSLTAMASVLIAATMAAAGGTSSSAEPAFILGERLVLAKRKLMVLSRDDEFDLGGGEGSAADPVVNGGTLRVLSTDADVFDTTYDLPKTGWRYLKKKGALVGYTYRAKKDIRHVVVRVGKGVRVDGSGPGLGHTLGGAPDEVRVVLTLGSRPYCTAFDGVGKFKEGKLFTSGATHAPTRCPLPFGADSAWLCRPG